MAEFWLGLGASAATTLAACAAAVTGTRRKTRLTTLALEKSRLEAELDATRTALRSVEAASGASDKPVPQ